MADDVFEDMVETQWAMQVNSFDVDPLEMVGEERIEFIRWNTLALINELNEMLDETGWKPWAASRHVNEQAAIGEQVDAWHFLMNLMMACSPRGMGPEEVARVFATRYYSKQQVNVQRQKDGYDGVTGKCPSCKRDLKETRPIAHIRNDTYQCPCGKWLPATDWTNA